MEEDLETPLNDPAFWHQRYTQQIRWTESARRYLFAKTRVKTSDHFLEVGCGTGALLGAMCADGTHHLTGIDIDLPALSYATQPKQAVCADGLSLPFGKNTFDHSVCHFTLMWVNDPEKMVNDMVRVTKPGGWVFVLAESDYSNRISQPEELVKLAGLQTAALEKQGANTKMGLVLASLLPKCGLVNVISGKIGYTNTDNGQNAFSGDLRVLRNDLVQVLLERELDFVLKEALHAAKEKGAKWYVPIFYACGQVS